jgi:hypothetical protein
MILYEFDCILLKICPNEYSVGQCIISGQPKAIVLDFMEMSLACYKGRALVYEMLGRMTDV